MGDWLKARLWAMVIVSALAGMLGFALAWTVWHLVQDHALFHQLVQAEIQREQREAGRPPALPGK